ncbi:MAG: bifunctional methylenetetrahydrofolate dehydrogenase/methenyltetrahydrofolate cyclohydrolase FolD, partial [Mailhella sp.]|nr:bifunctional methylenetetrahydrofolate dehydrogenase/methenyltetrahydrofolate cyclohydrolase FolD [Mailhella sp.]
MTTILDGKATAAEIRTAVRSTVERDREKAGRAPCLAVILVGDNPASQTYVRNKEKACADAAIDTASYRLPSTASQSEVEELIAGLNANPAIDGILLQLPLPNGLDARPCIHAISPDKDVDGLTVVNQGKMVMGLPGLRPCTPAGILALLDRYGISVSCKKVAVLGRSELVGRSIAILMSSQERNATVTLCYSRTPDVAAVCRDSDIIVAALGKPRFLTADMVKPGAVIIDVGINRSADGRLCGDVDYDSVAPIASAITPVPGGIGPMTISQLLVNTEQAWRKTFFG